MKSFIKKFIGDKAFYKEMFFVALPIALQQLIAASANIFDSAMIGRWGNSHFGEGGSEIATSAIIIAGRYMATFESIMILLAISCTIFIAQYFGAKNYESLKKIFGFALKLTVSFGFIALILGFFFRREIIYFFATGLGSGEQMLELGRNYLGIVAFTFVPFSITVALSFTLRSINKTMLPLISSGSAALINIILNYIFIYPMNMGVTGAALATLISRLIEMGILLVYYYKYKPIFYDKFGYLMATPKSLAINVVKKGWILVLAQVLIEGLNVFMFFAYSRIDKGNAINIATVNLTARIVDLIFAFVGGMGTAATILVGTRLGAGKIEEAKRNARWQIGYIILMSFVTVIIMIAIIPLMQLTFDFGDEGKRMLMVTMILQALSLPFFFYAFNITFVTRAGGYTRAPIYITNIPFIFIKVPLVILFVFVLPDFVMTHPGLGRLFSWFGLPANLVIFIFLIERVIDVIRAIIAYFVYTKANWQMDLTKQVAKNLKEVITI